MTKETEKSLFLHSVDSCMNPGKALMKANTEVNILGGKGGQGRC